MSFLYFMWFMFIWFISILVPKVFFFVFRPHDEATFGQHDQDVPGTPNYKFLYIQYIKDIIRKLDNLIVTIRRRTSPEVSHRDIIVISVGSWPTSFGTLEEFKVEVPKLLKKIVEIKRDQTLSKMRLIFWTPPSVPDAIGFIQRMRNQFDVGAMLGYLIQELERLGVEILDMYNPTNIFHNVNLCNAHYICARPTFGIMNVEGVVGWAVLDAFITLICDAQ